jgi:hypothetical protein
MLSKNISTKLAAFATAMIIPLVITPTLVSAIVTNAVAAPAQGKTFTKVKDIAKKVCELGGCWAIIERVTEYFTTSQDLSESPSMCSGKGCSTIRTGGSAVKTGETRTIVSKVRIR